ncbi:MAG: serine hydrolase [Clostridiaceae bacterium]|nr:serine hydrolase [Clostridiaceae bacterium]
MEYKNLNVKHNYQKSIQRQRKIILALCAFISVSCIIVVILFIQSSMGERHDVPKSSSAKATEMTGSTLSTDVSLSESGTVSTHAQSTLTAEERESMRVALESSLSDKIAAYNGRYSLCYLNLENGEAIVINGSQPMVAASSIKIAYNTALYQKIELGDFLPENKLAYNSAAYPTGDYEAGTGTIQNSADGTEFTISEVSSLSIRISDNCATNMILRLLGGIDVVNSSYMKPISQEVDYRSSVSYTDYKGLAQSGRHRTSAVDLAKFAQQLYDLYNANPTVYQPLIDDLSNTDYSWGIASGVSSGTIVAHKVGFNSAYGVNNDVAIVFGLEDYALCIMTETGDDATAKANIKELASMVDSFIVSCNT